MFLRKGVRYIPDVAADVLNMGDVAVAELDALHSHSFSNGPPCRPLRPLLYLLNA